MQESTIPSWFTSWAPASTEAMMAGGGHVATIPKDTKSSIEELNSQIPKFSNTLTPDDEILRMH